MKKILFTLFVIISSPLQNVLAQDHGHFYVGAVNRSGPLVIQNAADFATNVNYVKTLTYTNAGKFAGRFEGNITFEAVSAFNALGDPNPDSAAPGSWVHAQITSVEGPFGGIFSYWEAGALAPTIEIPCGSTSTNLWVISNNNGAPDSDPFGHIHGRRFTATKPGVYIVSFKAVDRSSNGADGGTLHTDSEELKVFFQAGINMVSLIRTGNVNTVTFGGLQTTAGTTFHLEANSDLSNTNWVSVDSIPGTDYFLSLSETNSNNPRFYRLRLTSP